MYANKRTRLDLDADSHETLRYFGLLRGVTAGAVMRQQLARYSKDVEREFPPVRAHMLAWRQAIEAQRANPRLAWKPEEWAQTHPTSDPNEIPF